MYSTHFRFFEVHPVYPKARSNPTFPSVENPETTLVPETKVYIKFDNDTIIKSNLFTVSVELDELNSDGSAVRTKFIKPNAVNINTKTLEISSKSSVSCAKEYNYYSDKCCYSSRERCLKLSLQFKVTFKFMGDFVESFSDAVKELENLASRSFGNILESGRCSDFTIIAENESFKIHRCILACVSSVFKTMFFTCGLKETKVNSTTFNCKPEVVRHLLNFIYEGSFPPVEELKSSDLSIDLFELADRFEIQILKEICKRYVLQLTIDKKNALKIYEFSSTYEIQLQLDSLWEIFKM